MPDHEIAALAAEVSAAVLMALRGGQVAGAALGSLGDAASHAALFRIISAVLPEDAVLSEEAADNGGRLDSERVWIIDPLDGTREYGEPGRTDWAVHVALWQRGHGLIAGAVALPARGLTLTTARPHGIQSSDDHDIRIVASRTRPPAIVEDVAAVLGGVVVPMGSAGAKIAAVILGEADVYVHAGGQYEWDSAAPVAVARAAGLHTSRLDGSPLVYNQPDPSLPDLVVCRPELAPTVLAVTSGR